MPTDPPRDVASGSVGAELLSASVNRHAVILSDRLLKFSLGSVEMFIRSAALFWMKSFGVFFVFFFSAAR